MNIFFTSDCYFGRRLTAVERNFIDEEDMMESYIESWNSRVGKNDVVYHLGNFSWDPLSCEAAMIHLNGKISFIGGLYDSHLPEMSLIKIGRHHIINNSIAVLPEHNIVMSHWPLIDWPGKSEGSIHVHGGDIPMSLDEKRFNANINNWNGSPIEFEFFKELIDSQTP
jgi:calcineurin-like phosphoesterase family protein